LGTLLGQHKINIAGMSLSRDVVGGEALTLVNLDSRPSPELLEKLLADPDISTARIIEL
jgi:D-3-phosphoglycerate dehydrogenase